MPNFRQGTDLQSIHVCDVDPTIPPGIPGGTPNMLLIRTDINQLYYYKGPLDTNWTMLGSPPTPAGIEIGRMSLAGVFTPLFNSGQGIGTFSKLGFLQSFLQVTDDGAGVAYAQLAGGTWVNITDASRTTTTSNVFSAKLAQTVPYFGVFQQTIRIGWKAQVDNAGTAGAFGEFRLQDTTTGLTMDGTQSFLSQAAGERAFVTDSFNCPASFVWAHPLISVQWGIGGVDSTIEADFSNGSKLNFHASFLRVRAFVETFNQSESPAGYVLGAFIGPSQNGGDSTAQRTINIGAVGVAPAASTVFPVPRYAKLVQPHFFPHTFLEFTRIVFFRDRAATIESGEVLIFGGAGAGFPTSSEWSLIPNGSYYFRIINGSGVAITNIEIIFQLSL